VNRKSIIIAHGDDPVHGLVLWLTILVGHASALTPAEHLAYQNFLAAVKHLQDTCTEGQ
jgi:hypothetical protein